MKVVISKSCATLVNGRARSLPKGSEHDLPDALARSLVDGNMATAVKAEPEPKPKRTRKKAAPKRVDVAAVEETEPEVTDPEPEDVTVTEPEPDGKATLADFIPDDDE